MAKSGDGTASLNEVFTTLGDGFSALWESVWNYPIPWHWAIKAIGVVFLLFWGAFFAFFFYRFAVALGKFLWDLLTIAWLLTKRRLKP